MIQIQCHLWLEQSRWTVQKLDIVWPFSLNTSHFLVFWIGIFLFLVMWNKIFSWFTILNLLGQLITKLLRFFHCNIHRDACHLNLLRVQIVQKYLSNFKFSSPFFFYTNPALTWISHNDKCDYTDYNCKGIMWLTAVTAPLCLWQGISKNEVIITESWLINFMMSELRHLRGGEMLVV